jgi:uncharacterized protein (UPF0548 family)
MVGSDIRPLWRRAVTYAAVGGTQADDLLKYPPKGFRPIERRVRIGHGPERWEHAWAEAMSFGIQRRSGFRVRRVESPAVVLDNTYTPVVFDEAGHPVQPSSTTSGESVYSPSGTELVRPGDTAVLLLGWRGLSFRIPVRVVYVVDDPNRRGFAYGTLKGHPKRGEKAFVVERRDDDSVWLVIRAFSRPANLLWRVGYPALRLMQAVFTSRYEHSLTRPLGG